MYTHNGPPLYLTADREQVVEEGDPRAAFLLVATGGQLPDEEAKRYNLPTQSQAPETTIGSAGADSPPAEEKASSGGSANKVRQPNAENKAAAEPDDKEVDETVVFDPDPAFMRPGEQADEEAPSTAPPLTTPRKNTK